MLISSVAGLRGVPFAPAYQVVKGALPQFARAAAREFADDNIRVNVVAPGVIRTRFHDAMTPETKKHNLDNRIPLHREGTPEQVRAIDRRVGRQRLHHGRNPGDRRWPDDADCLKQQAHSVCRPPEADDFCKKRLKPHGGRHRADGTRSVPATFRGRHTECACHFSWSTTPGFFFPTPDFSAAAGLRSKSLPVLLSQWTLRTFKRCSP